MCDCNHVRTDLSTVFSTVDERAIEGNRYVAPTEVLPHWIMVAATGLQESIMARQVTITLDEEPSAHFSTGIEQQSVPIAVIFVRSKSPNVSSLLNGSSKLDSKSAHEWAGRGFFRSLARIARLGNVDMKTFCHR